MKPFLFKSGELRSRAAQSNAKLYGLILGAEAAQSSFNEVTFVTLTSHYKDTVTDIAIDRLRGDLVSESRFFSNLEKKIRHIMSSGEIRVREYIKIHDNFDVTICVNESAITDETVDNLIKMLSEVNIVPGAMYEFGESITFSPNEIPTFDVSES